MGTLWYENNLYYSTSTNPVDCKNPNKLDQICLCLIPPTADVIGIVATGTGCTTNGANICESCSKGYSGVTCLDIDECEGNPCPAHATCVNSKGGFVCTCDAAYGGNTCSDIDKCAESRCWDVNECAAPNDCAEGTCRNYEGGYACDRIEGCMDPQGLNYNELANIPGECNYRCSIKVTVE
jgi:hypothetical protein